MNIKAIILALVIGICGAYALKIYVEPWVVVTTCENLIEC